MAASTVQSSFSEATDVPKQAPRFGLLFLKSQRKGKKMLGSMMRSFRLSSKKQLHDNGDLLKVAMESPKTPQQLSPSATLESSIKLLSSPSFDENRKGLELLILLTKLNKIIFSPRADVSRRIVLGGNEKTANRVRNLLLSFLCNDMDVHDTPDDEDSIISALSDDFVGLNDDTTWDDDYDDDDEGEIPSGRHWGSLHGLALRVIASCLEHLATPQSFKEKQEVSIDYSGIFWKKVVRILSQNIEGEFSTEVAAFSLRCLRLLVTLDAHFILPMLKYTLLPYIFNLQEYGDSQNYPLIKDEATQLLKCLV